MRPGLHQSCFSCHAVTLPVRVNGMIWYNTNQVVRRYVLYIYRYCQVCKYMVHFYFFHLLEYTSDNDENAQWAFILMLWQRLRTFRPIGSSFGLMGGTFNGCYHHSENHLSSGNDEGLSCSGSLNPDTVCNLPIRTRLRCSILRPKFFSLSESLITCFCHLLRRDLDLYLIITFYIKRTRNDLSVYT